MQKNSCFSRLSSSFGPISDIPSDTKMIKIKTFYFAFAITTTEKLKKKVSRRKK